MPLSFTGELSILDSSGGGGESSSHGGFSSSGEQLSPSAPAPVFGSSGGAVADDESGSPKKSGAADQVGTESNVDAVTRAWKLAVKLRKLIYERTGCCASAGIGPNKFLVRVTNLTSLVVPVFRLCSA